MSRNAGCALGGTEILKDLEARLSNPNLRIAQRFRRYAPFVSLGKREEFKREANPDGFRRKTVKSA